jgi:hypothetical protein
MPDTHVSRLREIAGKLLDLADEAGSEPRVLPEGGYGVGDARALAVPSTRIKKLADATLSRQSKWHE